MGGLRQRPNRLRNPSDGCQIVRIRSSDWSGSSGFKKAGSGLRLESDSRACRACKAMWPKAVPDSSSAKRCQPPGFVHQRADRAVHLHAREHRASVSLVRNRFRAVTPKSAMCRRRLDRGPGRELQESRAHFPDRSWPWASLSFRGDLATSSGYLSASVCRRRFQASEHCVLSFLATAANPGLP